MEPGAGAPWEWKPSPKIRRETKTRIKAKIRQKGDREKSVEKQSVDVFLI